MRDKRGRGKCALLLAAVMIAALLFCGCADKVRAGNGINATARGGKLGKDKL